MKYLRILGICLILAACSQAVESRATTSAPQSSPTTVFVVERTPVTETPVVSDAEMAELVVDAMGLGQTVQFCDALLQITNLVGVSAGRQAAYESFAENWDDASEASATFNEFESRC